MKAEDSQRLLMTLASHFIFFVTSYMGIGNDLIGVQRTGGLGQGTTSFSPSAYIPLVSTGSLFFYAMPNSPASFVPLKLGHVQRLTPRNLTSGTLRTCLRINDYDPGGGGDTGIL
jgi:hypothetical protein